MRVPYAVVGIWDEEMGEYTEYRPMIYHNGTWQGCLPYVYTDGQWEPCGHARSLMIPFLTKNGEYFYTSDGRMFLVRAHD